MGLPGTFPTYTNGGPKDPSIMLVSPVIRHRADVVEYDLDTRLGH